MENLTLKELREKAKELCIKGRWGMTKEELLIAIKNETNNELVKSEEELEEWDDVPEIDEEAKKARREKIEKTINVNGEERQIFTVKKEVKEEFIVNAPIGAMMAFEFNFFGKRKLISAKLINRNVKKKMLKLENKQGIEFVILFEDVAWVKNGKLWPKAIYEMLTGGKANVERDKFEPQKR